MILALLKKIFGTPSILNYYVMNNVTVDPLFFFFLIILFVCWYKYLDAMVCFFFRFFSNLWSIKDLNVWLFAGVILYNVIGGYFYDN